MGQLMTSILHDLQTTYYKEWDLFGDERLSTLVEHLKVYEEKATAAIKTLQPLLLTGMYPKYSDSITSVDITTLCSELVLNEYMAEQKGQNENLETCLATIEIEDDLKDALSSSYAKRVKHTFGEHNMIHLKEDECKDIENELRNLTENKLQKQTGCFWYPPKGYMGWHTNEDNTGYRIYIVYSENGDSFFTYKDPETGNLVNSFDNAGWNMRSFKVGNHAEPLWHCVASYTNRISLGFNINI
jgi:hypothetical protein